MSTLTALPPRNQDGFRLRAAGIQPRDGVEGSEFSIMDFEEPPGLSFDLLAASLRADARDLGTFLEALAAKLEDALPGAVAIHRQGGFLKRDHPAQNLKVSLGDHDFAIERVGTGVRCSVAHTIRGISVKTESVELEQWIEALSRDLAEHAKENTRARLALERLLT